MFLSTEISHKIWISSRFMNDSMHMSVCTCGPCPGTSSLPPQTCWSKQLPRLVSWLHSVGCSVSSQIQCLGSLYSAQTPVQPSSDPASAALLLPTDAWKCMHRYNWLNFQPSNTKGLKLHTEDFKSRNWDCMTHYHWLNYLFGVLAFVSFLISTKSKQHPKSGHKQNDTDKLSAAYS